MEEQQMYILLARFNKLTAKKYEIINEGEGDYVFVLQDKIITTGNAKRIKGLLERSIKTAKNVNLFYYKNK